MVKKIGIVTRDCAGINASLRAVVRSADHFGIQVFGFRRGYDGLIAGDYIPLDRRSVSGIINKGGTILKTSRSKEFKTKKGQEKAVKNINELEIDGIIVIGGNGSLAGARVLAETYDIPTIGVPATIDNDINGVEMSIGVDTAVNVAVEALDKIRDTAMSLERIFIVEVMGRDCGYIALRVALAAGCEEVLIPEKKIDFTRMYTDIIEGNKKGKVSWIIIVAEGKARASDIADAVRKKTGLETREAVLGHIQRGGTPTAFDRILASRLGFYAVELINKGVSNKCVCLNAGEFSTISFEQALQPKEIRVEGDYHLIKILT
jgi:6-phosphofructokinase 1